jgi:hypothetical protein
VSAHDCRLVAFARVFRRLREMSARLLRRAQRFATTYHSDALVKERKFGDNILAATGASFARLHRAYTLAR